MEYTLHDFDNHLIRGLYQCVLGVVYHIPFTFNLSGVCGIRMACIGSSDSYVFVLLFLPAFWLHGRDTFAMLYGLHGGNIGKDGFWHGRISFIGDYELLGTDNRGAPRYRNT